MDNDERAYESLLQQWLTRSPTEHDAIEFLSVRVARNDPVMLAARRWRNEVFDEQTDLAFCRPLLEGGLRLGSNERESCVMLVLASELQRHERDVLLRRKINRYQKSDPLFSSLPELLDEREKRHEMISIKHLRQLDRSGTFAFDTGTAVKLITGLDPEIVNYALQSGVEDLWVRLDPDYPASPHLPCASYTPPLNDEFATLLDGVPLRSLMATTSQGISPNNAYTQFYYYHFGLRKFETTGEHCEGGRHQFFIEELVDESSLRTGQNGIELENFKAPLLGRMIHFDTCADLDQTCDAVELCHLDCAITVYEGELKGKRLRNPFDDEARTSNRVHLFKAAPIPLRLLPGIAFLFFTRSQPWLQHWLQQLAQGESTMTSRMSRGNS